MAVLTPEHDERVIRDLVARFTDAVNRRRADELPALFVADGQWIVPGMPETRGPAIAPLLDVLLGKFPFLVQTVHSGRIGVDGDRARARWYLSEWARDHDGQGWHFIGSYHDELARVADEWRFVSRGFEFLYRGQVELSGKVTPFREPDGDAPWLD
jgi:hypothetical protein